MATRNTKPSFRDLCQFFATTRSSCFAGFDIGLKALITCVNSPSTPPFPISHEEDLSTKSSAPEAPSWLSASDANPGRPLDLEDAPFQRSEAPRCLIWNHSETRETFVESSRTGADAAAAVSSWSGRQAGRELPDSGWSSREAAGTPWPATA